MSSWRLLFSFSASLQRQFTHSTDMSSSTLGEVVSWRRERQRWFLLDAHVEKEKLYLYSGHFVSEIFTVSLRAKNRLYCAWKGYDVASGTCFLLWLLKFVWLRLSWIRSIYLSCPLVLQKVLRQKQRMRVWKARSDQQAWIHLFQ